jgi:outer membrane protein assembly factor BamB
MISFRLFAAPFVLILGALPSHAGDWPHFRGPNRNGIAAPQPIAPSWPEAGPPELWRRPFGSGFSTVSAVGDRLYTMGAIDDHEEALCLDAHTGKTLWHVPLGKRFVDKFGDGPRATPTVSGEDVFVVTSTMQLAALAAESGEERWRIDLLSKYNIQQPRFGFAPSATVVGDRVILEIGGGDGKAIVAFARDTGEEIWSALEGPAGSATPLLTEIAGVPQLIFSRRPELAALSLDGEVLWSYPAAPDVIVMAEFLAPDLLFTSSAKMGKGGEMLRVTSQDGKFSVEPVWVNRRFRNHFNNSVAVGGHLFGFDNSTLRCLEASSGEIRWSQRGLGKGSLIACEERLLVLGDQGTLALVAASAEGYQEFGRVQALQGRCWTSPTLASGRLLLRSLEEIVVYDVSPTGSDSPALTAISPDEPSLKILPFDEDQLNEILGNYEKARGGLDRWRQVETLQLTGTFSAFSESGPFTLQRCRDHLYRFDFSMAGDPDARGRDAQGLWWKYHLFEVTQPARVAMEPYHPQLQRESLFEPPLLAARDKGIKIEWVGAGEVDGQPTLDLLLTFPDELTETWKLHPETFLEVAVDSQTIDMTQAADPMDQRTYYSDFRDAEGLTLPFNIAREFGARLEEMKVDQVWINPSLAAEDFAMPAPPVTEDP